MHALRRQRKHSVITCRLAATLSTGAGPLQASSTVREDFLRMSRTRWKRLRGAVSLWEVGRIKRFMWLHTTKSA